MVRVTFCHYSRDMAGFPDQPKLGGTVDFALIHAAVRPPNGGAEPNDLLWMKKPGPSALAVCPASPPIGTLRTTQGGVPARQVDPSATGWLLRADTIGSNLISTQRVSKSGGGTPVLGATQFLPVTAYAAPPNARQFGASQLLDTGGSNFHQVTQSLDPRLGRTVLWAAHAVATAHGQAAVRWYEVDPAISVIKQSSEIASATESFFYPSIAPDRVWRSATAKGFGSNMVLQFVMSSEQMHPTLVMVSKLAANPTSRVTFVYSSPGPLVEVECPNPGDTCRYGDFSGASPSPNASLSASTGVVYLSNQYASGSLEPSVFNWRTKVWSATP